MTENESFSKVKERLESWEEGVSGMSCCEIWHVGVGMYTIAAFLEGFVCEETIAS